MGASLYWRRAWFVDVANRYAGHISGLKIGFIKNPEHFREWRCYAINCPCTVANDLPRLFDQAKKLFIEALSCEACARARFGNRSAAFHGALAILNSRRVTP
jgi:hypothetical protein